MAQNREAIAIGCGREGIGVIRLSVNLIPTFFAARNSKLAQSLLRIQLEECAVIRDDGYRNAQLDDRVVVRMLRGSPAAAALQALLAPAAEGAAAGAAAAAAAAAGTTTIVVSTAATLSLLYVLNSKLSVHVAHHET
jgi:hypothetical protein